MQKVVPLDAVLIPPNAQCVFRRVIYNVYQWQQPLFDHTEATFEMLRRADSVSTIGIVGDCIIVLKDEQPHRGSKLSFGGGRVDPGDRTILAAAQREMREETGYSFKNWRLVKVWQPHTKIEWFIYVFIAWDGDKTAEPHLDGGERITVELLPFQTVKQLATARTPYLDESDTLFSGAQSVRDLLQLPEFAGKPYGHSVH